jgi:hypothetical protein
VPILGGVIQVLSGVTLDALFGVVAGIVVLLAVLGIGRVFRRPATA